MSAVVATSLLVRNRLGRAVLALLIGSVGVLATAGPANAAVVAPFTSDYDKVVFGEFIIAGNVVHQCPVAATDCISGQSSNSSTLGAPQINDYHYMRPVDIDSDPSTFNSSSARITIPAGATIDYARLWWVGNSGAAVKSNGASIFSCQASQPNTASPNVATAPTGFPNSAGPTSTNPVKMKLNGGTYSSLTPQRFTQDAAAGNGGRHYSASADIKALVAAQPTGAPIDITVGNIWTPSGNNCVGGWEIGIVWKFANPDPTFAPKPRQVLFFDGFVSQGKADAPTQANLTGFTLVGGTRRLGVGIIEGDQGITGDQVKASGVALTEPRIAPATTTNFNASTVDGSLDPDFNNTYGLDAKTIEVASTVLPNGATNIPIVFTTSGDQYFPYMFAFSAPVDTSFISGTVWTDADGDGVIDPGEVPLPGTIITLTGTDVLGNPVTRTATTDAGGAYRFEGLLNGTYTVTETQPAGYGNSPATTNPPFGTNTRTSLVISGTSPVGITQVNFAEKLSTISGTVYHDQDAGGAKNGAEPGIAGVTVQLTGTDVNGNAVTRTATTDGSGNYSFGDLLQGTYTVTETQPAGWGDGAETAGSSGGSLASNDKISAINLAAASASTGNNFGEKKAGLSGSVYVDSNNNGIKDTGEAPIAGVVITVTGTTESGTPVSVTATTDGSGIYSFPTLLPGTYTVTETQPVQWGDGIDTVGTVNGSPVGSVTNDSINTVVLTGAGAGSAYNFGERPGTISGSAWFDKNADGVKDPTETTGLGGVSLVLTGTDAAGNPVSISATTATDGSYSFTNVPAGTNYTITETQPSGYGSSLNGTSITGINLPPGGTVVDQNFGETRASISGKVFLDTVNDNVYTAGENGVSGTTVRLYNAAGTVLLATTTTDAAGNYTFGDLPPGTYRVLETQPSGLTDDADSLGTGNVGGTVGVDQFSNIVLGAGVQATGYNFGETGVTLSGAVYVDNNEDGARGTGEPGIPGVTMTLQVSLCLNGANFYTTHLASGACPAAYPNQGWYNPALPGVNLATAGTATTAADGNYFFTDLNAAYHYRVVEGVVANYADGAETPGAPADGTTPIPAVNVMTPNGNDVLETGPTNFSGLLHPSGSANNNFGELGGKISGYVYVDAANDSTRTGDAPISGVLITVTDGTTTWTAVTDAAGFYSIAGLPVPAAGRTYTVTQTQPSAYVDGQESSTGTANPAGVNDTMSITLTQASRLSTENNFGERLASISGRIWLDADNDGVRDVTETTGIGGTITLLDGAGAVIATIPTNSDGTYTFPNLPLGQYSVVETQPAGYGSSTANSLPVTLNSLSATNVDFGETLGSITGAVYQDTNHNGLRDPGEPPIGGVNVTLQDTDPLTPDITVPTQSDGSYTFPGLKADTYTIVESQPPAYGDGSETVGTAGGSSTPTDTINAVTLDGGENAVGYLFGEIPAFVEGRVYLDANRDGSQTGDSGLGGIVITLDDGNPLTPNLTAVTDSNGYYRFPTVVAGSYTIIETQPAGFGSSETPSNSRAVVVPIAGLSNQDFGDTLGSLSGKVFVDANNNGVQDAGEGPISGVTVTLNGIDASGASVLRTATTLPDGSYTFANLPAGTYTVSETQPANFADGIDTIGTISGTPVGSVTPDSFVTVVVGPQQDAVAYNFAEVGTFISGSVFRDLDKDGVHDTTGDSPLVGVLIELYDASGTMLLASTPTLADGSYSFPNLPLATYVVKETQPIGYGNTSGPLGTNSRTVNAPVGGVTGIDFGDTLGSLGGTVFADITDGGGMNGIDTGIPGVTVTLTGLDANGAAVNRTAVSGPNGTYVFDNLLAGTYTITETQPAGWSDDDDNAGTAGGTLANDVTSAIALPVGTDGSNYNFGERGAAVVGVVYQDTNRNGVQDPGEPGIAGVTVTLDDGDPLTVDPTRASASDGSYVFQGVPAGVFTVTESQPAGYGSTSSSFPEGPDTRSVTVTPDSVSRVNFADTVSTIAGRVYADNNGNGIFDGGDVGIAGVPVELTGVDAASNSVTRNVVTAADGTYVFVDLLAGTYEVVEAQPPRYSDSVETGDPALTPVLTTDDHIGDMNLSVGTDSVGNNFAEIGATLTGTVWVDGDGDGVLDPTPTDKTLGGITITVTNADGVVLGTAVTNPDGTYAIKGLPGGVALTVTQTQPPVWMTLSSNTVPVILPKAGTGVVDFREAGGSLHGVVFNDLNRDGVRNYSPTGSPTEPGIAGVIVTLDDGDPLTPDPTTTTAADGSYSFLNLPAGTYSVIETHPAQFQDSVDLVGTLAGNAAIDERLGSIVVDPGDLGTRYDYAEIGARVLGTVWVDADNDGAIDAEEATRLADVVMELDDGDPLTPNAIAVTDSLGNYIFKGVPAGTYTIIQQQPSGYTSTTPNNRQIAVAVDPISRLIADVIDQNFGESLPGISGVSYFDANDNGVQDNGEPGIPGVLITLTGTALDGTTVSLTATTGADGSYSFPALKPGTYRVTETHPAAWRDGRESLPSGTVSPTNDVIEVVLTGGIPMAGLNFGELGWDVSGAVVFDGSGTGLADTLLVLSGTDVLGRPVTVSITTGLDGSYRVPNLPPGSYTITEAQPAGVADGVTQADNVIEVLLTGGNSLVNNFSEHGSEISGTVFVDLNSNGVQDPGETPIAGVTVTITGTDVAGNVVTRSMVTSADGRFVFSDLRAGDYTLTETQPIAYRDASNTAGSAGGAVEANKVSNIRLGAGAVATDYRFGELIRKLPATGNDVRLWLQMAFGLFLLGSLLVFAARRRRPARTC
jgi:large repetitive protein